MAVFKDYRQWHILKTKIENEQKSPLFREREVWWCSIGFNIGAEEDGKNQLFERPVLILKKFNRDIFCGLPLTSRQKEGKFYSSFFLRQIKRTAILSQIRILSGKRLIRRIGSIGRKQFSILGNSAANIIKTDPLNEDPRVPSGNLY